MKPPRKPARRRKISPAKRLRRFWILIAVVGVLVAGGVTVLVTWPGFSPRYVVVSGNRAVPTGEIVRAAAVAPHVNMWMQNSGAIARRVEAIPYVGSASVARIPPATVAIAVVERTPFAVLHSGAQAAVVDRALRVLAPAQAADGARLPSLFVKAGLSLDPGSFVTDPAAVELRDDYLAMVAAHVIPVAMGLDKYGGVVATVAGGVRVLLGEDEDMDRKLALVDPILAQVARGGRRIASIDLRAPNTPVVDFR